MVFTPLNYDDGQLVSMSFAASITVLKGSALADDTNGLLTNASGGQGTDVTHVAMETVTTGSSTGDLVLCIRTQGTVFEADTDANPAQTDVLTYVDLAGAASINPNAVADGLFFLEGIVGAVGDQKVRGWFVHGATNS